MEFSAVSSDLSAVLALARAIVPSRTTIPLLQNVLISCAPGGITLTCSDMMMEVSATEPCEVIEPGDITVPAHALYSLVKGMPSTKMVTLKTEEGRAILSCGRSVYNLGVLPAADFPMMPEISAPTFSLSLKVSDLTEMIVATRSTTLAQSAAHFHLQGICVHTLDDDLVFVSTNGKQFTQIKRAKPDGVGDIDVKAAPIIPNAAIKAISTILAAQDPEDTASLRFDKNRLWLTVGSVKFGAKLIAAEYLEYERLLPDPRKVSFRVGAGALNEALNRLIVVYSGTDMKAPLVIVSCSDGAIELVSGKISGDHGSEIVEAEILERMPSFGVSAQFLSELVAMWPDDAMLQFNSQNPSAPILITCAQFPDRKQLVMPMNQGTQVAKKQVEESAEAA